LNIRASNDRRELALGSSSRHVQRSLSATRPMTWSTCWPHPDHVVLPQFAHLVGLHMSLLHVGLNVAEEMYVLRREPATSDAG
jgi:hypothetical protein